MLTARPADDLILRNLQASIVRLREEMTAVELWAGALNTFAKPVPGYDPTQSRYAMPPERRRDRAPSANAISTANRQR